MHYEELTQQVIGACFEVSNELGIGFLESVYENALLIALRDRGLKAQRQIPIQVSFRKQPVGEFYADIVVEEKVIVELKAARKLAVEHVAQVLNYLRATGKDVALLVNFGTKRLEYRRFNNRLETII